jgi:acetyltransferase-like isoleucine patch superfamily enzyme
MDTKKVSEEKRETVEIQKELFKENKSSIEKYMELVVGKKSWFGLFRYEMVLLFSSWVPGALGIFLRGMLYPLVLGKVGKGVRFGTGVVLRSPHKIGIDDNVVIDDNCVLDAKGYDNGGISIGKNVFLGRNTILSCKNGDIILGDGVNIGFNCEIFSASRVVLGNNILIAAYTYLIGGGHDFDRTDIPVIQQGRGSKGISVGDNVWLGAGVKVLDGISIGRDAIIGTGAVVTTEIPDYSIAVGMPARVIKTRNGNTGESERELECHPQLGTH